MRMSVLLHICATLGIRYLKGRVILEIQSVCTNLFVCCMGCKCFQESKTFAVAVSKDAQLT